MVCAASDHGLLAEGGPCLFPQQRKLMGSSAQISSGVCRCGFEEQVPEEGSKRFRRRVPVCAGVGSGGRFRIRRVPFRSSEGSRCALVQVPEAGFGKFRRVPVCAGVGSGNRFGKVPVCAGVGSGGRFRIRRVPVCAGVGSGCNFRKVPEGSGECGLLPCSLDRSSHMIVFEHLLVMTLSAWAKPLRSKNAPM